MKKEMKNLEERERERERRGRLKFRDDGMRVSV
jgi:hypothetical protein